MPNVPLIVQSDFFCGPAALAMVMQWSGGDESQQAIAATAFTPGANGTYLADMLGAARREGYLATEVADLPGLLSEIEAGHPVIVFQNLGLSWAPAWHYGVVTGYDLSNDVVTLHSGQNRVMEMPVSLFLRTWDRGNRWAITVLPPDRLPWAASERAALEAAAGLERVGQLTAAVAAYRSGAARWPSSWLWPFGLGNALYEQGDLAGAETAFARAVALNPDAVPAHNNLKEVRRERGS